MHKKIITLQKVKTAHTPAKTITRFVLSYRKLAYFVIAPRVVTQIQINKQVISRLNAKNSSMAVAVLNSGPIAANRISARWSNDEYQLAMKGMRKFGKDFQSVADIIGTKNESQVNQFFINYRKKFNLDDIIKEFEANQLQEQQQKNKEPQNKRTMSTNSTRASDTKSDVQKPVSDDDVMEVSNDRLVSVCLTNHLSVDLGKLNE